MHRTLAIAAVLAAVDAFAAPVPVTTCGQQVTTRSAELVGDLDCSGSGVDAVTIVNGGRLELNGFTLTADGSNDGVVCNRACKVLGPGTITGGNLAAFLFGPSGRIKVDGVTITGANTGVTGPRVSVHGSTLTGNNVGASVAPTTLKGAVIRDSTITGSGSRGVFAQGVIRLVDSTVTGSGGACSPGLICCDLVAQAQPRVRGTSTCGTSCANQVGAPTWGVCADD